MPFTKQSAFSKKPADLPDVPSDTLTPTDIKSYFETPSDELMTTLNNMIDILNAVLSGNSGADNIGATGFDGTASNIQALLNYLKANKTDLTGDHKGTWQGYTPSKADPGISSVVDQHTAQLADIAYDAKSSKYGAKGDGLTTDITPLNNAVNDAHTNGGKVFLPPGQFYIDSDLIIPEKVDVEGSGVGETLALAKTVILLGDNASVIVKGRNASLDNLLITPKNPSTHTKDGLVIGSDTDNASRFKARRLAVNQCGLWGIRLKQSNGYVIEAQTNNNKGKGFGIEPTVDSNVHGGQIRIDAYGNGDDGIDLNSAIGVSGSVLSQSNHGHGVRISGLGNTVNGYLEYNGLTGLDGTGTINNGKYNLALDGNASGNDVTFTIFDKNLGNKMWYAKSNLKQNNFVKYTDGDTPTKGGYFGTTRLRLDWVNDVLANVDTPTGGDIIYISGAEPNGKGLYKFDTAFGWLRLDGVTFRGLPGTPNKGLEIHDTSDNRRKYYDGSTWQILSRYVPAPASATATGAQGDWSSDGMYLYVCYATNSWRRVAVSSW